MIGSLWNGISGLNSFQQALQTESNNITNVNTVGYKADKSHFEDMLYKNGIGGGTSMMTVQKSFEQGSINPTGNAYDMALSGDGFFVVNNKGAEYAYTRAGNFKMGTNGTLQTADGKDIMGIAVGTKKPSDVVSTNPEIDEFDNEYSTYIASQVVSTDSLTQTINAKATDYVSAAKSDPDSQSGQNYKTNTTKIADATLLEREYRDQLNKYASDPNATNIAPTNQTNDFTLDTDLLKKEGDSIRIKIGTRTIVQGFDTNVNTTIKKLVDQISKLEGVKANAELDVSGNVTGKVNMELMVPGEQMVVDNLSISSGTSEATFAVNGTKAVTGSGMLAVQTVRDALKDAVVAAGGHFLEITSTVNHPGTGTIANNLQPIQLKLDTVGVASIEGTNLNAFGDDITVDENGSVFVGKDGNKFVVGKIKIARFNDNTGLEPIGNNLFEKNKSFW